MAASIRRLNPVPRQQGIQIPGLIPVAQWIDALVLAANVAQTYTLPIDNTQALGARHGTILRITANAGPIYINFAATAIVAVANILGTAPIMLRTDMGPVLLAVPTGATTVSIISPGAAIVTVEAWS